MSTPVPLKSSAARPQSAFQSNARIPLEYCDGPTQRIYAVSAFVFLQAMKLYYWLGIARSDYAAEFFGFILWLALDVAFLMALNYLRIPWLELPVIRMLIALFTLAIINFVLFTASEVKTIQDYSTGTKNVACRTIDSGCSHNLLNTGVKARVVDADLDESNCEKVLNRIGILVSHQERVARGTVGKWIRICS